MYVWMQKQINAFYFFTYLLKAKPQEIVGDTSNLLLFRDETLTLVIKQSQKAINEWS